MAEQFTTTCVPFDSAHPAVELLRRYALGRLPGGDIEDCATHLESCHTCRQFVESIPGDQLVALVQSSGQSDTPRGPTVPLRLHRGYELLEEVGRGGMAVVFKARQLDLGRIVALKQIKQEVITADGLARFRAEASAMARVQHPNIVQVYDVGEQDGRPYLACEFVSGGGLDRQLTGNPLPVRVACQLLATLARTVQVAHDQAVIHRDLKPSNVLLSWEGSVAADPSDERFWNRVTPKIGDFGLAKHLDQVQSQTQTGAILGTPGYMAPEQAHGRNDAIGPATDVFALGVMLYETLTGRRPFQGATLVQTLDLICSAEPVPPSRWQPRLPRDLDVVCLKCLEKEPRRRYATAVELADDLERWLAGKPILARPAAGWERAWKWARRHPASAALLAGIVVLVVSGVSGILWHNHRLQAEVRRANANEAVAIADYRRGHDVIHGMIEDVLEQASWTESFRTLREQIFVRARDYHERALQGADDSNADVRLAKAMAKTYLGSMDSVDGDFTTALRHLEPALEQLEAVRRESRNDADARSRLAACYRNLAMAHDGLENTGAAEQEFQLALELLQGLLAEGRNADPRPEDRDLHRRVAQLHTHLGWRHLTRDRKPLAEGEFQQALQSWQALAQGESLRPGDRANFGESCIELAKLCAEDGRMDEAESYLRHGESVLTGSTSARSLWSRKVLAETYWQWAQLAIARSQPDLAQVQADKAVREVSDVLDLEPSDEAARAAVARYRAGSPGLAEIAAVRLPAVVELRVASRWDEADLALRQIESRLSELRDVTPSPQLDQTLSDVYFEWAELEIGRGRLDDAMQRYNQSTTLLASILEQQPNASATQAALSHRFRLQAWHLTRADRIDWAFACWDQAIHFATGDVRHFTQAERALERALLGDHEGAAREADEVPKSLELQGSTAVHLARVYSCAIRALPQDSRIAPADRDRLALRYAAAAIDCFRQIETTYLAESGRLNELDSDPQLEALRTTTEFRKWRQTR